MNAELSFPLAARAALLISLAWLGTPPLKAQETAQRPEAEDRSERTAEPTAEPSATDTAATFRLYSRRPIGPQLRPLGSVRLRLLAPVFSPVVPDFDDLALESGPRFSAALDLVYLDPSGAASSAKAQQFRDLSDGPAIGVDAQHRGRRTWLRATGRQLLRDDFEALFELRVIDGFSLRLERDDLPQNFAFGARSLYRGVGSGSLVIDDSIQAFLQGSTSLEDAAARARLMVDTNAVAVDLAATRERLSIELDITRLDPLAVELDFSQESRHGAQPKGASFSLANAVEIPWPVDTRTENGVATLEWARGKTLVRASARRSELRNAVSTLEFDNPWRIADSPGGLASSFTSGPARGAIDLDPDNRQEERTLQVIGRDLPGKSTIAVTSTWGEIRQDDPLLAFTTNTSLRGRTPGGQPFDATDPANLPRDSAEARFESRLFHVRFTSQPHQRLRLRAEVRDYRLDNQTPPFAVPGFATEDSVWRSFFPAGGSYRSPPIGFRRSSAELEVGIDLPGRTQLLAGWEHERWDREFREAARTDEDRFRLALNTRPAPWADLRVSYLRSAREVRDYDFDQFFTRQGLTFVPVLPFLVKFDQAARDRDRLQVIASFLPTAELSIGVQVVAGGDDYPESPFGVRSDDHRVSALDVSWSPSDRVSLFASASREHYDLAMANREWNFGLPGDPFNRDRGLESTSNWSARSTDDLDTITLGAELTLIADRLHFDLAYSWTRSDGRIGYNSPLGSIDSNAFVPAPFEDVDDIDFWSLNPRLRYQFAKRRTLTLGYLAEDYGLGDFAIRGFASVPVTPGGAFNGGIFQGTFPIAYDLEIVYLQLGLAW